MITKYSNIGVYMKHLNNSIIFLSLALGFISVAHSQESLDSQALWESNNALHWSCEAQGKQSFNIPPGGNYISTWGEGDNEIDASNVALRNCRNMGLQACMIINCFKSQR
jgi:hypothetical protein